MEWELVSGQAWALASEEELARPTRLNFYKRAFLNRTNKTIQLIQVEQVSERVSVVRVWVARVLAE
jgi:hypothetical protein